MKYKDKAGQVYDDLQSAVKTWCWAWKRDGGCLTCPLFPLVSDKQSCEEFVRSCPSIVVRICEIEEIEDDQEAKYDGGKIHPSYVSPESIVAIAKVREYGTQKYKDPNNWKRVSFDRYHEALLRHALGMWNDPYAIDPESGLPHLYHLMCNGNFLCALEGKHEEHTKTSDG